MTDNYVVLVGHKHYSSGIHARSFYKPTNSASNIFSSGPTLYNHLAYSGFAVLGDTYGDYPVWCTHTGDLRTRGNVVAIACMAPRSVGGSVEFGYTIKKYNAASPLSFSTQLFYPISTTFNPLWKVRDIRYDALSNNLLVLHDADAPDGSLRSMVSVAWGDGVTSSSLNMVNGMFDWCIAKPVASPCFEVFPPTRALMGNGSGLDNTPVIPRSTPTLVLENDYSVQTTPVNPLCKE